MDKGRAGRLWALVILFVSVASIPLAAQDDTDVITGTVTGPDSQPLAGAVVQATSLATQGSRQHVTDARGRFTIVFPDGGGRYQLVVRYIGMAPVERKLKRGDDEDRLVANVQMGASAVALEAVTVSAQKSARTSPPGGPGSAEHRVKWEELARLPMDAADLNTAATLAPGVLGLAGGDSSAAAFSVAGQRPTANNVTLDGLSLGSGGVPQDAVRSMKVVTSSYNVERGQFTGGVLAAKTRRGTNLLQGSFTYTLRDRSIAWGEATASPFGQGSTQHQLGGGIGGPIIPNRLFFFGALQGRWRDQPLPSLVTADPVTLERLGVSPDSAARFRAIASGAPVTVPGLSDDRATNNTLALVRLDWLVSDMHALTLRFDGRWESQQPSRVSALALPATGGTRSERAGGIMASLTSHFGASVVNELGAYLSRSRRDARAFLALPAARVEVASDLTDGDRSVATLTGGGNAALPQHTDNRSVEITDDLSWLPGSAGHKVKFGAYLNGTRITENQTRNQLGTFIYPSLEALAADRPSSYTRTLAPLSQTGTAWNGAVYLGDSWSGGGGGRLQLRYGVRLEAARFTGAPAYNPTVDFLFAARTDRIPRDVHLSPRVGFAWEVAGGADESHSSMLRGGVGGFRSPTPSFLYGAALGAPGFSSAETEVVCIGSAVPRPDWSSYARDPSTIPSHCADTAAAVVATPRPNATVFAPGYAAPRVWRASLGLVQRFGDTYTVTVEGTYARGVSQYGFRDLNLVATPRFLLAGEANRPVYVPVDSIIPATGALGSTASRRHPEFGQVLAIGSDLQSDTKQVTLSFAGATARGASLRLSYTLTRVRDQSSFACCAASQGFAAPTTAGDPNAREWATSDLERRHSFFAVASYPVSEALDIGAIARLSSGEPFTPVVASDINGDGARNDRAFVFPPASADTAVASGMRALLADAPPAARTCLARQIGRVAARNSCTGPWQPSLDLQLNWRPAWFGSERRLTLSLLTLNLLGGLDEWLHGAAQLHGWGYASDPDPVLLYVRGFDPTAARYQYVVNGRFGSTASASRGLTVPFQLAFQGRLMIGRGKVRASRATASAPPSPPKPSPPSPLPVTPAASRSIAGAERAETPTAAVPVVWTLLNPVAAILGMRDSLGLSADQSRQLQAMSDSVHENIWRTLERVRAVLTAEQWRKLAEAFKSP